jgi:hypothetical protein
MEASCRRTHGNISELGCEWLATSRAIKDEKQKEKG